MANVNKNANLEIKRLNHLIKEGEKREYELTEKIKEKENALITLAKSIDKLEIAYDTLIKAIMKRGFWSRVFNKPIPMPTKLNSQATVEVKK